MGLGFWLSEKQKVESKKELACASLRVGVGSGDRLTLKMGAFSSHTHLGCTGFHPDWVSWGKTLGENT